MKFLIISAILLQAWCNAYPKPKGVATYAFRDSAGNRYGGTYDLEDNVVPFNDPILTPYSDPYVPDFFNNFGDILPQIFGSDIKGQRLALLAAQRALDLTNNHGGYNPNFFRFPFGGFPFGPSAFNMNRFGQNSAFAGAALGPGYRRQSAIINPGNADMPNVDITDRFADPASGDGKFYSVSSSSFASSNNDNGKVDGFRQAETVVNDNGKITKYRVHN